MSDLISRADAIEAVRGLSVLVDDEDFSCFEDALNALPSAELTLQTPQTYGKSINPSNSEVVEDYISRADALMELNGVCSNWQDDAKVADIIHALPSADAVSREAHYDAVANRITDMEERGFVSVVRCKDCLYKQLMDEGDTKYYYCALEDRPNRNWSVDDTDYCSWGERSEE